MSDEVKKTAEAIHAAKIKGILAWVQERHTHERPSMTDDFYAGWFAAEKLYQGHAYMDLQALVASHAQLLEAAKEMHDNLAFHWQDAEYEKIFEQAEKLLRESE